MFGYLALVVQGSSLSPSRRAIRACVFVTVTAFMCAGLMAVAILMPAPPFALPVIVAVCIGLPMAAALELPAALRVLGGARRRRRHLSALRRDLARLPETRHPLDL